MGWHLCQEPWCCWNYVKGVVNAVASCQGEQKAEYADAATHIRRASCQTSSIMCYFYFFLLARSKSWPVVKNGVFTSLCIHLLINEITQDLPAHLKHIQVSRALKSFPSRESMVSFIKQETYLGSVLMEIWFNFLLFLPQLPVEGTKTSLSLASFTDRYHIFLLLLLWYMEALHKENSRSKAGCRKDLGSLVTRSYPQVAIRLLTRTGSSPGVLLGWSVEVGLAICPASQPRTEPNPETKHRNFYPLLSLLTCSLCDNVALTKCNKNKLPHAVIARCILLPMRHAWKEWRTPFQPGIRKEPCKITLACGC